METDSDGEYIQKSDLEQRGRSSRRSSSVVRGSSKTRVSLKHSRFPRSLSRTSSRGRGDGGMRRATLYDAVAGRITTSGFLPPYRNTSLRSVPRALSQTLFGKRTTSHSPTPIPSTPHRDYLSQSLRPLRPEQALYRQSKAPDLDEDVEREYFENRRFGVNHHYGPLRESEVESQPYNAKCEQEHQEQNKAKQPDRQYKLPESDMLKAIHTYTADYFDRKGTQGFVWQSMDETALLALGVLLEESMADFVKGGEGAFIEGWEGEHDDDDEDEEEASEEGTVDEQEEENEDEENGGSEDESDESEESGEEDEDMESSRSVVNSSGTSQRNDSEDVGDDSMETVGNGQLPSDDPDESHDRSSSVEAGMDASAQTNSDRHHEKERRTEDRDDDQAEFDSTDSVEDEDEADEDEADEDEADEDEAEDGDEDEVEDEDESKRDVESRDQNENKNESESSDKESNANTDTEVYSNIHGTSTKSRQRQLPRNHTNANQPKITNRNIHHSETLTANPNHYISSQDSNDNAINPSNRYDDTSISGNDAEISDARPTKRARLMSQVRSGDSQEEAVLYSSRQDDEKTEEDSDRSDLESELESKSEYASESAPGSESNSEMSA